MRNALFTGFVLSILLAGFIRNAHSATIRVLVSDDRGTPVKDAVVYAELKEGKYPPPKKMTATMDQQNKEFIPYVLPVQIGTSVNFPNSDNIRHHVYSFSPAKKFELPLYKGKPGNPVVFDKQGAVAVGCNIHDWMIAYIYVVDTPYFAKTSENGKSNLSDLPAALYEIKVWHPRMKSASEITAKQLRIQKNEELDYRIELKPEWRLHRPPPSGTGRY